MLISSCLFLTTIALKDLSGLRAAFVDANLVISSWPLTKVLLELLDINWFTNYCINQKECLFSKYMQDKNKKE